MGGLTSKVVWGVDEVPELIIPVKIADGSVVPEYNSTGAAGFELRAAQRTELETGVPVSIDTGVSIALPFMLCGQVIGISSLALKHNIQVFNSVIDTDSSETIKIVLVQNRSLDPEAPSFVVEKGTVIATLSIMPLARPCFNVVSELPVHREDVVPEAKPAPVAMPKIAPEFEAKDHV